MKTAEGTFENLGAVVYEDDSPFIEHYGVKGMHWGVRNSETLARYSREKSASRSIKATKKAEASKIKEQRKQLKRDQKTNDIVNKERRKLIAQERKNAQKNRSLLTEAELDARIRRLQKERQLALLTQQELEPGRTALRQALLNVGQEAVRTEGRRVTKTASKRARESIRNFPRP